MTGNRYLIDYQNILISGSELACIISGFSEISSDENGLPREAKMSEVLAWIIVVGLALTIAGIFMLATQVDRYMQRTLEMMTYSNAMFAARLEQTDGATLGQQDPYTGDLFDRRRAQRRNSAHAAVVTAARERRTGRDRRVAGRHSALG